MVVIDRDGKVSGLINALLPSRWRGVGSLGYIVDDDDDGDDSYDFENQYLSYKAKRSQAKR